MCTQNEATVKKNQAKLKSIFETILLCGRQGLSLGVHRDDHKSQENDPLHNHGNFLALLEFCVKSGDQILENHLKSGKANAMYTSKTVQNEFIEICGNIVREKNFDGCLIFTVFFYNC